MSYRTYVNGVQLFGNNDCYPEWIEFIKSQGIEVNERCGYFGEVKDFMAMLQVVEQITLRIEKDRRLMKKELMKALKTLPEENRKEAYAKFAPQVKSIFDLTSIPNELENDKKNDKFVTSLFDELTEYIRSGYAFLPYQLYLACKDKLEQADVFSTDGHFECYRLKDGETIHVRAC